VDGATGSRGRDGVRVSRLDEGTIGSATALAALRHCREITRRCARNFYYGLKLSPEPQRSALYVIYAWMRRADDLVDNAATPDTSAIEARLQSFRDATDAALRGSPMNNDPLWIGLADTATRFRLPAEHFHAMLDGQVEDLAKPSYATFEDLRGYCYRVASTVGLICIEVWGYSDRSARELAVERGIAFQLTNILRDYRQDYEAGRIYLPLEDFERHGITPQELRDWSHPQECHALMRQQIERTESYYRRSAALDGMIAPGCRPTLWAMTTIYHGLLRKMMNNPSKLMLGGRLRLSALQKGTIALRAKWISRVARSDSSFNESVTVEKAR
jgi:15-cis-phytoene synthase